MIRWGKAPEFIEKKFRRSRSLHTRRYYEAGIRRFRQYAEEKGITIRVADVYFPDLTRNLTTKWMKQDHFWDAEQFDASLKRNFEALERTGSIPPIAPDIIWIEPIDRHVLLVAAEVEPDRWVAYIGAVEGKHFEKEAAGVMVNGSQIPFELAEIFFEDEARNSSLRYLLKSKPGSG